MLRLFIKEKIKTAQRRRESKSTMPRRNRRIFQRFPVDHKHLTLLNEQDILLVRELSAKGLSSFVSERSYERFSVGDVYSARVRHLGDIFDLDIKVSWKSGTNTVGFELIKPNTSTRSFIKRLLFPMALAASLKKVDAKFMESQADKKIWYHGESDTDLYIWRDESSDIHTWQFISKDLFVEWRVGLGVRTGHIAIRDESVSGILEMSPRSLSQVIDPKPSQETIQLVTDVIYASQIEEKETLIKTLTHE